MAGSGVLVVRADLHDPAHAAAWKACTQAYASDPMGGASPLTEELLQRSVVGLRDLPSSLVFLAFDGAAPAGMATCFRAWSTFAARPLINVHDLAVNAAYRGNGVGGALLRAVEAAARAEGCGKARAAAPRGRTLALLVLCKRV